MAKMENLPRNAQEWVKPLKHGEHRGVKAQQQESAKLLAKALKMRFVDHVPYPDISKVVGIPESTLKTWLKPFAVIMENPEEVKQFKTYEADIMDGIRFLMARGMVDKLTDENMRKRMDLSRLTYGYGVLYDKMRLERGESTSNTNLTLSELVKAAHARPVNAEPPAEAEIVAPPQITGEVPPK